MAMYKEKSALISSSQKLEQNQGLFFFLPNPDIRDLFSEVGLN